MVRGLQVEEVVIYGDAKLYFSKNDIYFLALQIATEAKKGTMTVHSEEFIRTAIENDDAVCAVYRGRVIGFAALIHWKSYVEIGCLFVDPVFRQRGVATGLVNRSIDVYSQNYKEDKELIGFTNVISAKIFEKSGFVGYPKNYFDDDVWEDCAGCKEEAFFPKCRCNGMIYSSVGVSDLSCASEDVVVDVCKLYCNIWSEPPWNEMWEESDVHDILSELFTAKHDHLAFYLQVNNAVRGFAWGKYVTQRCMHDISSGGDFAPLFSSGKRVFYINELAVDKLCRKKGLGKMLIQEIINSLGEVNVCLRTDECAYAAKALYKSLGFDQMDIADKKHISRTYWLLKK